VFLLTHETLEAGVDASAVLDQCGLAPMMPMTGMIAERILPATRAPQNLELTRPEGDGGCGAILDVNSMAYGMDLGAGKTVLGRSFWKDHFPVLGLTGGKPACGRGHDGRWISLRRTSLVATDPEQQRRGYGDAAMRRALELAATTHGEQPTILHATDAGRPVYERMGYTPISSHTIFLEKKFLAGH